jgi:hypothetical protein
MKWEYKITGVVAEEGLNQLGNDGWEFIAVIFNDSAKVYKMFFKRPKQ